MSSHEMFTARDTTWFLRHPTDAEQVMIGFVGESERVTLPIADLLAFVADYTRVGSKMADERDYQSDHFTRDDLVALVAAVLWSGELVAAQAFRMRQELQTPPGEAEWEQVSYEDVIQRASALIGLSRIEGAKFRHRDHG